MWKTLVWKVECFISVSDFMTWFLWSKDIIHYNFRLYFMFSKKLDSLYNWNISSNSAFGHKCWWLLGKEFLLFLFSPKTTRRKRGVVFVWFWLAGIMLEKKRSSQVSWSLIPNVGNSNPAIWILWFCSFNRCFKLFFVKPCESNRKKHVFCS